MARSSLVVLVAMLLPVTLNALTCAENSDLCAKGEDVSGLLQTKVVREPTLERRVEPSLEGEGESSDYSSVQEVTTVEVDMATTKIFEGVPVFNYHFANQGGMNPSALELSEQKKWIVNFKDDVSDGDLETFCANPPGNSECSFVGHPSEGGVPFAEFKGIEHELKEIIKGDKHLKPKFVEPDGTVSSVPELYLKEEGDSFLELGEQGVRSWGLDRIDDKKGTDGSYNPVTQKEGAGAHVYIADTGIRTSHQDFEGRAVPAIDALSGIKECNGDQSCAYDKHGHGTHCAGTVGGKTYGVAKQTALYAVKVLNDRGDGSFAGIINSVDWVASKGRKPAVWSASLGGKGVMHSIEKAFATALSKDVTISVAAGNHGGDACDYSPAFAPSALTVGASYIPGGKDRRAGFSNYGTCVDIFAPGVQIRSASHLSAASSATMSGTSMACPHVSGVAALLLGDNPGMSPKGLETAMKAMAGRDLVSHSKGTPNLMLYTGSGSATTPTKAPTDAGAANCPSANNWWGRRRHTHVPPLPYGKKAVCISRDGGKTWRWIAPRTLVRKISWWVWFDYYLVDCSGPIETLLAYYVKHNSRNFRTQTTVDYIKEQCEDSFGLFHFYVASNNRFRRTSETGQYFNIKAKAELAEFGGKTTMTVKQCRNGAVQWKGPVIIWGVKNGGTGDVDSYGRRVSGWAPGQWLVGDMITTAEACPQ